MLLRLADGLPDDESDNVDRVLEGCSDGELQQFLHDELTSDPGMRDRFLARFGEPTAKSVGEFRAEIDRHYEEKTEASPVVFEPIDFSQFFDLAAEHREQGEYRSAATVYRALVEALDENMDLVDGAYDHYSRAFRDALDGYVDCVVLGDLSRREIDEHIEFLESCASSGTDYLQEQYQTVINELRDRVNTEL